MSTQASAITQDMREFLIRIGIPAAGPQLLNEGAGRTADLLDTFAPERRHEILDLLARSLVQQAAGEASAEELPTDISSFDLVLVVASALKKIAPSNREAAFATAAAEAKAAQVQQERVRESLSQARFVVEGNSLARRFTQAMIGESSREQTPNKNLEEEVRARGGDHSQIAGQPLQANPGEGPNIASKGGDHQQIAGQPSQAPPGERPPNVSQGKGPQEAQGTSVSIQEPPSGHPGSTPEPRKPPEETTEDMIKRIAAESVDRALARAKVAKRLVCKICGFQASRCICGGLAALPAGPSGPTLPPQPPEHKAREPSAAEKAAQEAASEPTTASDTDSSDTSSASPSDFSRAGRVTPNKSAEKLLQLKGAPWEDEAVILNPALWAARLAERPADEFQLERAWAQRWLTAPSGGTLPQKSLRTLAVDNLRFFIRLCGPDPSPEQLRFATRNVDELEITLFRDQGAKEEEVQEFRRRLSGQDRPSRYKKAWSTKVSGKTPASPTKRKTQGKKKAADAAVAKKTA